MESIEVPAPTFAVTSGAYTSYSLYLAGNVSGANNCDAGTIYGLQSVTPKIASSLLSNSNYTKSHSVTLDNTAVSSETAAGQSWAEHTVKASYTFAGTTCSTDHKVHITGLPYTAAPPKNSGDHPWTEDQRGWGVVYFQWNDTEFITWNTSGSGNTNIIGSPNFYIPSSISVNIIMTAHGRYVSTWPGYEYDVKTKIHAGGNNKEITVDGSDNNYDEYSITNLSLTSNSNKVQIENTHNSGDNRRLHIKSVYVSYR